MFSYGQIIEYIDSTYDENLTNAISWAKANDAKVIELLDKRAYTDIPTYDENGEQTGTTSVLIRQFEIVQNPPVTDEELIENRKNLYMKISDPIYMAILRGDTSYTINDYLSAVAQIQFDNKKASQADMSYDDFLEKVTKEFSNRPLGG